MTPLFPSVPVALLLLSAIASAAQMPPAPEPLMLPTPESPTIVYESSAPLQLYTNVRYKDLRNIHPCAVEKIIAVPDPCPDECACGPQCVYIRVCVPPCDCYETKCKRRGRKLVMDFGDYKVEVTSARGHITVDYDD